MPVHKIEHDRQSKWIRIWKSASGYVEYVYTALPDNPTQLQLDAVKDSIQHSLDKRILLQNLAPQDDERKADPGKAWCFWEGDGKLASTWLVTRTIAVTEVEYDPVGGLSIGLRRTL